MCDYYKNYYIYSTCADPGIHFIRISIDGSRDFRCATGPHERYIVVAGTCPVCK